MNNQMTEDLERVTARAVECGAVTIGEPERLMDEGRVIRERSQPYVYRRK